MLVRTLATLRFLLANVEKGLDLDVIYLDFAKAFDKVNHNILLKKLSHIGIRGNLHNWFEDYISNRKQRACIGGILSDAEKVLSGVPQGSVLGPILFIIMMNDIERDFSYSRISSFADHTKITKTISDSTDPIKLQSDLHSVDKWAKNNLMSFNVYKFVNMKYSMKNTIDRVDYTVENANI